MPAELKTEQNTVKLF